MQSELFLYFNKDNKMNNQLIEKVIKTNNGSCPDLVFANPLLDRNIARALSKSFVQMFTTSRHTSNVHNNLRHTVLNNVRKICKIEPDNHLKIREDTIDVLCECYVKNIEEISLNTQSLEKQLDDYLTRRMSEYNYTPKIELVQNPEIVQALLNLNSSHTEILTKNLLNWGIDEKTLNILKYLWTSELAKENIYNDLSVKIKSEIEKNVLHKIHLILTDREADIDSIFDNDDFMKQLVSTCSVSHNCFHICCGIMNYIFITTNFDHRIQSFIAIFLNNVKQCCTKPTISVLYPRHLSQIVLLLDIDVHKLPGTTKSKYVDVVINNFHELCDKSESDLIMLLSHFPQWFEIYFIVKEL